MKRTVANQQLPFGVRELGYVRNAAAYPQDKTPEVLKMALLGLFVGAEWTARWEGRLPDYLMHEDLRKLVCREFGRSEEGLYQREAALFPMGPRLGQIFAEFSKRVFDCEPVDVAAVERHLDVFFQEPEGLSEWDAPARPNRTDSRA